jgi:outer membrane lipoprotein carrier protein
MRPLPLILVLALCIPGIATAAPSTQSLIDRVEHRYQQITDLKTTFEQKTFIKTLNRSLSTPGTLYLKKPGKVRIEYQGSSPRHYVTNGKHLWVYTPGDREVMKNTVGKGGIPPEALAFLGGFGELRRLFHVEAVRAVGREIAMTLRPKSITSYRQLDGRFDADGRLIRLKIFNSSGGHATYDFQQIEENRGLADGLFRYRRRSRPRRK